VCANDDSGSCRERALEFLDNEEGKETYAKDDSGLCSKLQGKETWVK
jgi:hypothetical protein